MLNTWRYMCLCSDHLSVESMSLAKHFSFVVTNVKCMRVPCVCRSNDTESFRRLIRIRFAHVATYFILYCRFALPFDKNLLPLNRFSSLQLFLNWFAYEFVYMSKTLVFADSIHYLKDKCLYIQQRNKYICITPTVFFAAPISKMKLWIGKIVAKKKSVSTIRSQMVKKKKNQTFLYSYMLVAELNVTLHLTTQGIPLECDIDFDHRMNEWINHLAQNQSIIYYCIIISISHINFNEANQLAYDTQYVM